MKIQIYSDLHLEFEALTPAGTDADLVILAGDIHKKTHGVTWANDSFSCPVVYVPGNHEFYSGHLDRTLLKMKAAAAQHVHVLENEVFVLNDSRFLCATGWTDFTATGDVIAATREAWNCMNDFVAIRAHEGYRKLRPVDVIERNRMTHDFLKAELAKPFPGRTVVVTHHCPIAEVSGSKHDGHLSAAYYNRWQHLVVQANMWVFGHTHCAVDMQLGGCRLISNPGGYPGEKTGFINGLVVEL